MEVCGGQRFGPHRLGAHVNDVIAGILQERPRPRIDVRFDGHDCLRSDILIFREEEGVLLRFSPDTQRLRVIDVYDTALAGPMVVGQRKVAGTASFDEIYHAAGSAFPATADAELGLLVLSYDGVVFGFEIEGTHRGLGSDEIIELRDAGPRCRRVIVFAGPSPRGGSPAVATSAAAAAAATQDGPDPGAGAERAPATTTPATAAAGEAGAAAEWTEVPLRARPACDGRPASSASPSHRKGAAAAPAVEPGPAPSPGAAGLGVVAETGPAGFTVRLPCGSELRSGDHYQDLLAVLGSPDVIYPPPPAVAPGDDAAGAAAGSGEGEGGGAAPAAALGTAAGPAPSSPGPAPSGVRPRGGGPRLYRVAYFSAGVDAELCANTHALAKVALRTNLPGHPLFSVYRRCPFSLRVALAGGERAALDDTTPWSEAARRLQTTMPAMIARSGGADNPFAHVYVHTAPGCALEVTAQGRIASATLLDEPRLRGDALDAD